jgi:hypothetical protein
MIYVDKDTDEYVVACDNCDDELFTEELDFEDAVQVLREEKWKSAKVKNEWEHYCPDCLG